MVQRGFLSFLEEERGKRRNGSILKPFSGLKGVICFSFPPVLPSPLPCRPHFHFPIYGEWRHRIGSAWYGAWNSTGLSLPGWIAKSFKMVWVEDLKYFWLILSPARAVVQCSQCCDLPCPVLPVATLSKVMFVCLFVFLLSWFHRLDRSYHTLWFHVSLYFTWRVFPVFGSLVPQRQAGVSLGLSRDLALDAH